MAKTVTKYPQWEYYLLKAIGAPQNEAQLEALNLWWRNEGMPDAANNWLAITAPSSNLNEWGQIGSAPGVDNYGQNRNAIEPGVWNSFHNGQYHVLTFPTQSAGINALVSFLEHGHTDIITAFRDPSATVDSIGNAITADGGWGNDGRKIIAQSGGTSVYIGTNSPGGKAKTGVGQANNGGSNSSFTNCSSDQVIIGTPGIIGSFGKINILNACQAKAIVAGLTIGVGVAIIGFGFVQMGLAITARSTVGQAVLGTVGARVTGSVKKGTNQVIDNVSSAFRRPKTEDGDQYEWESDIREQVRQRNEQQ